MYDALTAAAATSQKESIEVLDAEGATYQTFYATNAIRVDAGDEALVEKLAGLGEVQSLWPTRDYAVEEPVKGKDVKDVDAVEWGVANINADDVWNEFGTTGEGIVVGNIDTGVQFDHPALVNQYRGNNGDGTFNHNYNWFDAAGSCATAPCDNNGHGTHTMGTMVGDDGGANQIGVAPGAKWIAANGCCPSDEALIASGEWMLAPTDLDGREPRRQKRPHIVNNSWGSQVPSNDPFMEDVQEAWAASGHLRHLVQRQQRTGLPDERLTRQPDPELLGRRLRRQQQDRQLLLARRRAGRRAQAEHLRPGRQRPLEPAGRRLRRVQRHLDGRAAPGRHHRAAVVGRPVPRR